MSIGNRAIKISRFHWLGMFGSSLIYLKTNMKSPYHQISNQNGGKYDPKFDSITRIYGLLVLLMEPHANCTKCHFMGNTLVYLGFIVHENGIIANEEKITAIYDLTTLKKNPSRQKLSGASMVQYLVYEES